MSQAVAVAGSAPRTSSPPKAYDIQALALKAYEMGHGDWRKAANVFRGWLDADPGLFRTVMWPLVDGAVWALIRNAAAKERQRIAPGVKGPVSSSRYGAAGLKVIAERRWAGLMEFPLEGGVRLGEATAALLEQVAERYIKLGSTNYELGLWLRLVRRALPDEKTKVKKAMDEQKLAGMRERAAKIAKEKF